MNTPLHTETLSREAILTHIDVLADILENCVNGGASVSFMSPFTREKARAFWTGIAQSVGRNERTVLACIDKHDGIIGTVQLVTDQPENQPHRADVAKLLVHEKARRKGAALTLMASLETHARACGITVLVLDTATGSGAETFYQRAGWQKVGEIPRYALMPDGAMTATSVFYKFL
ncbi:GNAT family N-acetyltransferase [Enterobacter sp. RHBSTW-00994]|uniref:GNAT family N-acetyltransferase n=1 Tax=Enterobacter sp. RHBSTW-00994 TaxID=2742676 RepID=UPI0015EAFBCB|nr:GNAT family N-acetyltransferase [Enterobacter sp. RHBSTW-00994]QLR43159.1 GNAT family N-acetyltransferase [Enterobacter sp. RHBSTW-00994]